VLIVIAAILGFAGVGESAHLHWHDSAAVPPSLPVGATVVDRSVPVDVVPRVTAWTGSELLTFGVGGTRNVGAVYEPARGRWRAMSDIPFAAAMGGADAAWTGRFWVVAGVLCDAVGEGRPRSSDACDPGSFAAAAYEPGTDAWRTIDEPPSPVDAAFGPGHARSFGSAVGMLGRKAVFVIERQYMAFRPDSWDWEWLPQPPPAAAPACSVGGTLVAYDAHNASASVLAPGAIAWTRTAAVPAALGLRAADRPLGACTDSGVFVYSRDLHASAFFDLATRRWTAVEPPVLPSPGVFDAAAFSGRSLVFPRPGVSLAYDLQRRTWRPVPSDPVSRGSPVAWVRPDVGLYFSRDGALTAYRVD
jgi:hypothetical protein